MTKDAGKAKHAAAKTPPAEKLTAEVVPNKTDEANEAYGKKPKADKGADEAEQQVVYEQGRTARRARIAKADAPHADGPLLDAWLKGYEFEEKGE